MSYNVKCEICKGDISGNPAKSRLGCDDSENTRADSNMQYLAFYRELLDLVSKYSDIGVPLKPMHDAEHGIIRITGDSATPRARAVAGLADVVELAQSTAEHHPYWGLLYNASEIAGAVLDRWHDDLSDAQIDEIKWNIREMESALGHLKHDDN